MKKIQKIFFGLLVLISLLNQLLVFFPISSGNLADDENQISNLNLEVKPLTSDIAGTDLYAEQISAYVAGSKSIIQQSLFTNDTNIVSQFDTNDPAFEKCNVYLSISNGINPEMFPMILSENIFGTQLKFSYNGFIGFLYYDPSLNINTAQSRANRALDIIKMKFKMDIINVNSSNPRLFPFVGYYPEWGSLFEEITKNLPMDGYWKTLDIDRLTSNNYIHNYHLSVTYLLLNSLNEEFNISTDQLSFDSETIESSLSRFNDVENFMEQIGNIFEQLNDSNEGLLQALGFDNETISQEDIDQISGAFNLTSDSHYTTLTIQYEGLSNGIKKRVDNSYEFSLWDAIGYTGRSISPSEKIYIALLGALMSGIDINILGTDIIDATPDNFELSDFMLEQIGSVLEFTDVEFDIYSLEEYSFELLWYNDNGVIRSYARPVNLNDEEDILNLLGQYGFQGFSFIPTGLLNPMNNFIITYNVSNSEPVMIITKELMGDNASQGALQEFAFNITAKNVGNISIWGVPTTIPMDINTLLGDTLYNELWIAIDDIYNTGTKKYHSVEEFLNVDEDPRLFYFDTWGLGIIDYYYPVLNMTNIAPYSEEMANLIENIYDIPIGENPYASLIYAIEFFFGDEETAKDFFTNKESIWYEENWKLEPGEKISYTINNISIASLDTFSVFYSYNFTIEDPPYEKPFVKTGKILDETTPHMALLNDNKSWIIESEQISTDPELHELDIRFYFKNETTIDLINNTLDQVSIVINFSASDAIDTSSFEIFNFTEEVYNDMSPYFISSENHTWTFSFFNNSDDLDWLFEPNSPNDYIIRMRIRQINSESFNISINDLNVDFSQRDLNIFKAMGSRIIYATLSGTLHESRSNSIILNTNEAASIIAKASLSKYNLKSGEINNYSLKFRNIGTEEAQNINITIVVPGIVYDENNFTIEGDYLVYRLDNLQPREEKTISFAFYTPNSGFVKIKSVEYQNPIFIQNENSSILTSSSNTIYFSAPVDYETRFPFMRSVDISYQSSNIAPHIGALFNLTVIIKNTSPKAINIPEINLIMNDYYGNLKRIDNNTLTLQNITYNSNKSIFITLKKTDWKGYYYPSIEFLKGCESRTIQISKSLPIILGYVDFSIVKSINKDQVEIGDEVEVTLEIKNTGSICIKNINLNDMTSFKQIEFSLTDGKLVNEIDYILPGQTKTYKYTIKAKIQSSLTLNEAKLDYFYLRMQEEKSNDVEIKIISPRAIQFLFIGIPCAIAGIIIGAYYRKIYKYKSEKFELKRSEKDLFSLTSSESILKIEHTLRERIRILESESIN
ncbi:MAG: BatD family protein [Promethearchaeota archaeon]